MYKQFEKEIDALLSKMSLREKIGQLNQIPEPNSEEQVEEYKKMIRNGEIGSIILASSATAGNDEQNYIKVELLNQLQKVAVKEGPKCIPIIYGRDVIHGHHVVYPIPLASASSFNEELVEKCYQNIAEEATTDGIHWTFSPMLDLCRDPRWGRVIEGPGEDPFLGAKMGKACIRGFQGDNISDSNRLVACAKHYIGYGASEGGRDYHRTEISDYSLYNYYLPAFQSAIDEGVGTVMSSFNDINGQPVTSSYKYLTEILRTRLGFEGFVVSDWAAVQQLMRQGVAHERSSCAKLSVEAGVDMDMCDNCYIENLEELVGKGEISENIIDSAVRRILRIKFAKGLFSFPYCAEGTYDRKKHLSDARHLAEESIILLKNSGVLPLGKNCKIALEGPFLDDKRSLLGSWTLDYSMCDVDSMREAMTRENGQNLVGTISEADVVVLALGESWEVTGEAKSLANISLSAEQVKLIREIKCLGKQVVGVFFCGRPLALGEVETELDAILYAWHCGTQTANAVCDILLGKVVPSGKAAMTFPRTTGQIPIYYNVTSSGRYVNGYYGEEAQQCYMDSVGSPLYPFGYGLSYTTFAYEKPVLSQEYLTVEELKKGKQFTIRTNVKNTGNYDGKEVVQLYIRDVVASCMRPIRELKAFKKVSICKGDTVCIEFVLGYHELGYYNASGEYVVEPGVFEIFVGENCLTDNGISLIIG